MKVYAIIHYYDNGLAYQDCRDYVTTNLYSDLTKASEIYKSKTSGKYVGAFELVEWEIDTNNKKTLQDTGYMICAPDDPFEEEDKNWAYGDDDWEYIK